MEQNTLETVQLQNLPAHILTRIFMHLDYRERIRLESVCSTWRTIASKYAWKDQRILRFSREMLNTSQPWRDKRHIRHTNPQLIANDLNRQKREVIKLNAILHRCAPFLDEFHLLVRGGFINIQKQMRFGKIFSEYPFGRLAHLQIHVGLDCWHLRKIQCHLAPQLLSLAVVPINSNSIAAFKKLLANCNKLENLQFAMSFYNLFNYDDDYVHISCCIPSTLKCLFTSYRQCENSEVLVNQFLSLLTHCSQLRYMPILPDRDLLKVIGEKNTREFEKIIRLQFPYFIANEYSFRYIQRPEFRSLKAIHVDFKIGAEEISQIALCCPQLEHLGIHVSYNPAGDHDVEIASLVALRQFRHLSSLDILVEFEHLDEDVFRDGVFKMVCPGGEPVGKALFEILTELDRIHAMRSLDFKAVCYGYECKCGILSQDFLLQMSKQLKHLETFLSDFYLKNLHIDDTIGIGHFCARLEEIFDSKEGANKKSFKFAVVVNPSEWDYGDSRKRENLLVEWQKGSGTKRSKMYWHVLPSTWRGSTWHRGFELPRSIVLHELITNEFGQRTSSMLFDSFGMMQEEH